MSESGGQTNKPEDETPDTSNKSVEARTSPLSRSDLDEARIFLTGEIIVRIEDPNGILPMLSKLGQYGRKPRRSGYISILGGCCR